jgi:simple sugar transport system substrate-binding protein
MKTKRVRIVVGLILVSLLAGCAQGAQDLSEQPDKPEGSPIVVGFSQVGAESEWRVANSESMKSALSEENGYELIFDDARNEQENQIRAIRTFIQQDVDYIVFSPRVETGWTSILQEARDAGIPVIVIDRDIEVADRSLYTAYIGSDFRKEGDTAVQWLENLMQKRGKTDTPVRIVHIQGTIGSSAQIGRTAALEDALERNPNWQIVAQELGDFTRAKAYEVMGAILKETKEIDVVYCENDGEALGAIDAMEEAGLTCNTDGGVIVISFDATKLGLSYCLQGKIALNVECNPLQGPYVAGIIQRLERGETVEPVKHVDETAFDCFTITKEMIEGRGY